MGAVAGEAHLRRVVLPHYQADDLRQLLAWDCPGAICDAAPFERLIQLTRDYFNAKVTDFSEIQCNLAAAESFSGAVWRACRGIPHGQTESYADLARRIGRPEAARAVATAMGKNPIPLVVPCHRVVYADGRPGGFSSAGGPALKSRMLEMEKRTRPS
jgi:methylated-DNA-[protein]-cysteine S-methyltransferase